MSNSQNPDRRTRAFVSYARADRLFADRLCEQLIRHEFDALVDVQEIDKGEAWQERIQSLIFAADAVVFLISPESVASKVCDWEVNEAERLSKRILPVVCRETKTELIPGRLLRLNFTFLNDDSRWVAEFPKLCSALSQNIEWIREHTRIGELAGRWDREGRPDSHLLRLDVVRQARRWESDRPSNTPVLAPVIRDFIARSEEREIHDRDRLLATIGRAFVKPVEVAVNEGQFEIALRATAAGIVLAEDPELRLVPEREKCLREAIWSNRLRFMTRKDSRNMSKSCEFSADGNRVLISALSASELWSTAGDLVRNFEEEGSSVLGARFGAGCETVVTFGSRVRIWSAKDGSLLKEMSVGDDYVYDVDVSGDGNRLVTASNDIAKVWRLDHDADPVLLRGHQHEIRHARFDQTGDFIVTCSNDLTACVWNTRSGRVLTCFTGHEHPVKRNHLAIPGGRPHDGRAVMWASFHPDGSKVLSQGTDDTAQLWTRSGRVLAAFPTNPHSEATFSASGKYILNPTTDGTEIRTSGGRFLRSLERGCASIGLDDLQVVTGDIGGKISVWDARDSERITAISSPTCVDHVGLSPDATLIASAHGDGTVRLWHASRSREIATLEGHVGWVEAARYCLDGCVRTASLDGSIRTWNAETGDMVRSLTVSIEGTRDVFSPGSCFNAEGSLFACAADGELRVLDTVSGATLLSTGTLPGKVTSAALSDDGARVAAGFGDGSVYIYGPKVTDALRMDHQHKRAVREVAFTDHDNVLVSVSIGLVRVDDAKTGASVRAIEHLFLPCLVRGPGNVRILGKAMLPNPAVIDPLTNQTLFSLSSVDENHHSAALSPNGTILAAADKYALRLFDGRTGVLIGRLAEEARLVRSITFSNDSSRLVTGHISYEARIWDMTGVAALCGPSSDILCSAITNGRGQQTQSEESDLLMQSAPRNLYESLVAQLPTERATAVAERAQHLCSLLHPNCYGLKPASVMQRGKPTYAVIPWAAATAAVLALVALLVYLNQ